MSEPNLAVKGILIFVIVPTVIVIISLVYRKFKKGSFCPKKKQNNTPRKEIDTLNYPDLKDEF